MEANLTKGANQSSERSRAIFGIVAGLYVAALVSPALILVISKYVDGRTALISLVGVGLFLAIAVMVGVTRRTGIVDWLDSSWVASLLPIFGAVPAFAYTGLAFEYAVIIIADLPADTASGVIGFSGFILGIAATFLGSILVIMARRRVAQAMIDYEEVGAEWTAGWPLRHRLWTLFSGLTVIGGILVLGSIWTRDAPAIAFILVIPFMALFGGLAAKRTYRVTPYGLEQRLPASRRLFRWTQFDGFSVTENALILHRQRPYPNIICSRKHIIKDESAIVAALEDRLDRLDP